MLWARRTWTQCLRRIGVFGGTKEMPVGAEDTATALAKARTVGDRSCHVCEAP